MVTRARWVTVVLVCTLLLYPLGLVLRQVQDRSLSRPHAAGAVRAGTGSTSEETF